VRIGEFARASGVPIKTLRFYDEVGLFRPAGRDPLSGYRRYRPEQLSELAAILALRDLGVPLAEIRGARSTPRRRALLESAQKELRRSIDERSRSLRFVEAELRRLDAPPSSVVIRHRPALRVVSLRAKLGASSDVVELEEELSSLVPERSRGAWRGTLWHFCEDDAAGAEAEHFVELVGPSRLQAHVLPAVTAACAWAADDECASKAAFAEVRSWMSASSYQLAATKREIYWPGSLEIEFPFAVEV